MKQRLLLMQRQSPELNVTTVALKQAVLFTTATPLRHSTALRFG